MVSEGHHSHDFTFDVIGKNAQKNLYTSVNVPFDDKASVVESMG